MSPSLTSTPTTNEEQDPCLSSAERDGNETADDGSVTTLSGSEQVDTSLHGSQLDGKSYDQQPDLTRPIPRSLTVSWWSILVDVVSIWSTGPFFFLALVLARLEGQAVNEASQRGYENGIKVVSALLYCLGLSVLKATTILIKPAFCVQAATALPIIFAAIVGRLATQVARWRLERGASLPSIEQWLGCRTVASAFLTQFQLGGLNVIGVTMGTTWALSPLGAQAILRILGTRNLDIVTETSVVYFDTNTPSSFTDIDFMNGSAPDAVDYAALMNSIYTAALLAPDSTKADTQDAWGNIKIPYLDMSLTNTQQRSDGWVSVANDNTTRFSSLLGLAAVIRPQLGEKLRFTLESSYMELECSPFVPTASGVNDFLDSDYYSLYNNQSLLGAVSGWRQSGYATVENRTWQAMTGPDDRNHWVLALDTFVDPIWYDIWYERLTYPFVRRGVTPANFANETGIYTSRARLQVLIWFAARNHPSYSPRATTCWLSQPYVESQVECTWANSSLGRTCAVVAQRPSQELHVSTNITALSFQTVFAWYSQLLPTASGLLSYSFGLSDPSIMYLLNTSSSSLMGFASENFGNASAISAHDIGIRLGQILNTYQISSQAFESIASGVPTGDGILNTTAAGQTTRTEEVYSINKRWLAVFFIAAFVMLVASVLGAIFCHVSLTPEFLGFASSAIRDSKYVRLAPGFGALGGLEMTKAFEGIEFRYGVVEKREDGQEVLGISWKLGVEQAKQGVAYI